MTGYLVMCEIAFLTGCDENLRADSMKQRGVNGARIIARVKADRSGRSAASHHASWPGSFRCCIRRDRTPPGRDRDPRSRMRRADLRPWVDRWIPGLQKF